MYICDWANIHRTCVCTVSAHRVQATACYWLHAHTHSAMMMMLMMSLTLPLLANSSGVQPPAISHLHHSMLSELSIFFSGFSITSRTQFKLSVLPLTHSSLINAAPSRWPFRMTIAASSVTCSCEPSIVDVFAIIVPLFYNLLRFIAKFSTRFPRFRAHFAISFVFANIFFLLCFKMRECVFTQNCGCFTAFNRSHLIC